ncbi:putative 1,3-beta-glucan synthase [Helianthus anomalus]
MGSRARLGEIWSIEMVHKRFESFPKAFVDQLVSKQPKNLMSMSGQPVQSHEEKKTDKMYATQFSPFWNEIIKSLHEEYYIGPSVIGKWTCFLCQAILEVLD